MRVLQVLSACDVNGAVIHVRSLMEHLQERGHEVYLACPAHAWLAKQLPAERVLPTSLSRWPLAESRRVAAKIRELNIEVTHTHQSRAHSFGVMLRWLHGIPTVATAHNCRIQLHWALNNRVIGVSNQTTKFHRRFNLVGRRRSETIHNFVDLQAFAASNARDRRELRQEWQIGEDNIVGLVLGSVMKKKGLHVAIEALPKLIEGTPDFHLLIVGKPRPRDEEYAAALRKRIDELGMTPHVTWAGTRTDVPRVLQAVDMMVSASLEENFPISLLEAMAASLPVVATAVGGVAECVVDGVTGALVRPDSASEWGLAVDRLVRNPALRSAYGQAGRERVQDFFSTESQLPKIETALARAAGVSLPDDIGTPLAKGPSTGSQEKAKILH